MVNKSSSKSCLLDPIPTCLLKDCSSTVAVPIAEIINLSLSSGYVPRSLKVARVTPCLKKKSLDKDTFANYRPISNLPYLSKILERVVALQFQDYLISNDLLSTMQSAYRPCYSTETALLRVQNDILLALDSGKEVLLVLLDFSAAFDTIDHSMLIWRLEKRFGVTGTALTWFKSYLDSRYQMVNISDAQSSPSLLSSGVPQGSVLGPLLFTLYISPIEDIIKACGINCVFYADDSQLYITIESCTQLSSVKNLENCLSQIKQWTVENKLVLNDAKTEVIHFYSNFLKDHLQVTDVIVDQTSIMPSECARNLGVLFDKHLNMKSHIRNICKKATFALYNISKIRKYLDTATTERLVHAFITSVLDSCNSLLYGLPSTELDKLQHIQNSAARLVSRTKRHSHITPVLEKLHWLTIRKRIVFKMLLLMYKVNTNSAPSYLRELMNRHNPSRTLRSSKMMQYVVPSSRTVTFGDRAFAVAGPKLWNKLPMDIKSAPSTDCFKSKLKTYLFKHTL